MTDTEAADSTTTTDTESEGDKKVATATRTRARSTSRSSGRSNPKAGAAASKKATAVAKKVGKATTTTRSADSPLMLAAAYMKGKKPMIASDIAKGVMKSTKVPGKDPAYLIASSLHKAAREGHTVKRTKDKPALYSLR